MITERINPLFRALPSGTKPRFGRPKAKSPKKIKILYPPHQLSNRCPQRFGNGLNCKKTRIFNAPFYPAQKSPINVGFGSKRFLRQLFLRSEFPNSLTKPFGNVMTHLRQVCPFTEANGCRLYTTTPVDNGSAQCHNNPHWIFNQDVARQAYERRQSSEDPASARQKRAYNFLKAAEDFLKDLSICNVLVLTGYHRFKRCSNIFINSHP
jgi:hypothetical protein